MKTNPITEAIDTLRARLRALPDPLIECDACRLRNIGRADRTVCLHQAAK